MKEKIFCKKCKGLRNHTELHKVEKTGSDDSWDFRWFNSYSIIQCKGCDNISFLEVYGDTEMYNMVGDYEQEYYYENTVYPKYLENGNEISELKYLPKKIRIIYVETIASLKSNSSILTAGGLRAIIEGICNHLKIKGKNLAERIDKLSKNGHLTISESKRLHSIRFLGNDALHEIEKPKKEHLLILLEIINHLLANLFINDKKLKGKIEMMVDDFGDFIKLLQHKITKEMLGDEYTLQEILSKSKRLVNNANLTKFEIELEKKIKSKKIMFLEISKKNNKKYKVIGTPIFWL